MEDQKVFHNRDAFFIAEKLDAIKFSLPIPPHTEEEFHDKDVYIIWTKLTGGGGGSGKFGQVFVSANQGVANNAPIVWSGIKNNVGVNVAANQITVTDAGVYQLTWVVNTFFTPS